LLDSALAACGAPAPAAPKPTAPASATQIGQFYWNSVYIDTSAVLLTVAVSASSPA
jgi:hypothetical protein